VTCSRCSEAAGFKLQVCDLWKRLDEQAGYQRFKGGAAVNVKIRKNDQFRRGHQPRLGVLRNPEFDIIGHARVPARCWPRVARGPRIARETNCTKGQHPEQRCPLCPPYISPDDGRGFVTDRTPSPGDLSNMIVDGLRQVGFDTTLFSGISAPRRPLHRHRDRSPGTYSLDAARPRAGRRGAAIRPARQPRAAV
jgi:hypothetical protein